jgi:hypothetical protein
MLSPYVGPLAWAVGAGTAVAANAAETSLLTSVAASAKWAMPGGFFIAPGQMLRYTARGKISTPGATQGNPTFKLKIGAVAIATSPAFASRASMTNEYWSLEWLLSLQSVGDGTLAAFMHTGWFDSVLVSATNLRNPIPAAASAPANGTGFDSSAGAAFDHTVTWSNATAGNSIQLLQALLEAVV